ncbi:UNVERIFIED_CONTAM: hypothetical protein RMT77_017865 [Armadillidium vulgare]
MVSLKYFGLFLVLCFVALICEASPHSSGGASAGDVNLVDFNVHSTDPYLGNPPSVSAEDLAASVDSQEKDLEATALNFSANNFLS